MSRLLAPALAAGLLLAGCTGGAVDPAQPSPALAPPVAHPKDARGVDPCRLLTAPQLDALGLTGGRREDSSGLVACGWNAKDHLYGVGNTIDTEPGRQGLTGTYSRRSGYALFEPLEIDGYPAVRAELVDTGDCTIYLGLSDTQVVDVSTISSGLKDTCSITKRAISAMLTNLPSQR